MSLETPTTKEISDNIIAQLEASLNQSIPLLPKSFMRVMSKAIAAVFILLYKYGGFMFQQIFISLATIDETEINGKRVSPLIEWGRLTGVGDPASATQAELEINITVEVQGGTLPSGSQLVSSSTGVTYITIGNIALNLATVQAIVRAVSDQAGGNGAGIIGNLPIGSILSFANPLANVKRDTVVIDELVTGADAEATAVYRQRILDRWQVPPQGGALTDYRIWAEEPVGILNAYPYTSGCPGEVDVYIESATEPDGIPTAAQLTDALESIEFDEAGLASRRPAGAFVKTLPITRTAFDIEITGLVVDDEQTVLGTIEDGVREYFLGREPFILGLSVPPRKDQVARTSVGAVIDNVVSSAGGVYTSVVMKLNNVPLDLFTLGTGEKAKLGTFDSL